MTIRCKLFETAVTALLERGADVNIATSNVSMTNAAVAHVGASLVWLHMMLALWQFPSAKCLLPKWE
jgi:hypothetical protein